MNASLPLARDYSWPQILGGILVGAFLLFGAIVAGIVLCSSIEGVHFHNKSGLKVVSLRLNLKELGPLEDGRSRAKWYWVRRGKHTAIFEADFGVSKSTGFAVPYATEFGAGRTDVTFLPNGKYEVILEKKYIAHRADQ